MVHHGLNTLKHNYAPSEELIKLNGHLASLAKSICIREMGIWWVHVRLSVEMEQEEEECERAQNRKASLIPAILRPSGCGRNRMKSDDGHKHVKSPVMMEYNYT